MIKRVLWCAMVALALQLAGYGTATAVAAAAAPAEMAVAPPAVGSDYRIGPGDTLQIYVWRNPELTATIPVRPDGKISTPLVEDMIAVGKNPSQLARDVEKILSEYVKAPRVNVIVTNPVSYFSQVKIIGQVQHPQALPYREGMTVLDAVLSVGGLAPFAAGNRARLMRIENGKQKEIRLKLDKILDGGDMALNIPLQPGDVVLVPESRF